MQESAHAVDARGQRDAVTAAQWLRTSGAWRLAAPATL